jgi:hypothetical protein
MFGRTKRKSLLSGGSGRAGRYGSPTLAYRRRRFQRTLIAIAFLVLVAAITELPTLGVQSGRYDIDAEDVASKTVTADIPFHSDDLEATRERREEAVESVLPTLRVDVRHVSLLDDLLRGRIDTLIALRSNIDKGMREALSASHEGQAREEIITDTLRGFVEAWREDPAIENAEYPDVETLLVWLEPENESIPLRDFGDASGPAEPGVEAAPRPTVGLIEPPDGVSPFAQMEPLRELAQEGLEYVLTKGVNGLSNTSFPRVRVLRDNVYGDLKRSEEYDWSELLVPSSADAELKKHIEDGVKSLEAGDAEKSIAWERVQEAAYEMAKLLDITGTLYLDSVVTEGDREQRRAEVEPVQRDFGGNQIIIQEGHRWTEQSRSDAKTLWGLLEDGSQATRNVVSPIASNALLVALILVGLLRSMTMIRTKETDPSKSINVVLLVMCGTLILGRVMFYVQPSGLIVPVMASAILLCILTNSWIAAIANVCMGALLSIQYGYSWQLLITSCAMSFAGISSLYVVRRRGDMAGAAVKGTFVGLFVTLAIVLSTNSLTSWLTLNQLVMVGMNGVACLFLVPGLLSPLERLFGITTDIQYLEYSDLNNEILSRLAIEVPATYAHSLMLGQLAEAAADAIGANGLKARVCAYYHDIGKLRRPEYFSENQTGQNIHDDLSPRLSARAIASHVTEGVELARDFHLPEPIIDGILEHHGTNLIGFFHQLALEQQKHGDVREEDYRYPGPRPQSRETAILMICDGVESGVRSIKNANEERVREFIGKLIRSRAEDRQFDECELTLKELDIIEEVLTKRIITTLHTRVAYPEKKRDSKAANIIHISGGRE